MMARRWFTADFKTKVALEALRGDKTIKEIATKHKVHPNLVSAWKRRTMGGLGAVFPNGADKARVDHEDEVHGQHPAPHPFQASATSRGDSRQPTQGHARLK